MYSICESKTSGGACGRVSSDFELFLVGFCSELADLSRYAFALEVW